MHTRPFFPTALALGAALAFSAPVAEAQVLNGSKPLTDAAFGVSNTVCLPPPGAVTRDLPAVTLPAGTPSNGSLLPSLPALGVPVPPGTPNLPSLVHLSPLQTVPNPLPVSTSAPIGGLLAIAGGLPIPSSLPATPSPQPALETVFGAAAVGVPALGAVEGVAAAGAPAVNDVIASAPRPPTVDVPEAPALPELPGL